MDIQHAKICTIDVLKTDYSNLEV